MPDLMGMRNVLALNDEAHHCYREKSGEDDEGDLNVHPPHNVEVVASP